MLNDFRGKTVLVTGGTMGIGLATGLAFGRQGARCTLTYNWGSADEDEILRAYADAGAPPPRLVQADVSNDDDTDALLEDLRPACDGVDVFVSNVAMALLVRDLEDYSLRALTRSLEYTTWPMVEYTRRIKRVFGRYPRYIIGLSSAGVDSFLPNYDFAAASKAVLETLCRYLSYRLSGEDVRVNIVRAGPVRTASFEATFGDEIEAFFQRFGTRDPFIPAEEVAHAILALCSGLMDGVSGQIISVDRGLSFADSLMRVYDQREKLDL